MSNLLSDSTPGQTPAAASVTETDQLENPNKLALEPKDYSISGVKYDLGPQEEGYHTLHPAETARPPLENNQKENQSKKVTHRKLTGPAGGITGTFKPGLFLYGTLAGLAGLILMVVTVIIWSNLKEHGYNEQGYTSKELNGHTSFIYRTTWSPDGRYLASVSFDKTIRLWNATGQPLTILSDKIDYVLNLTWSPDSQILAAALLDSSGFTPSISKYPFSEVSNTTTSASKNTTIKVWNVGGQVMATLTGVSGLLAWSPDGKTLATANMNNTVSLWDTRGQQLGVLAGHSELVWDFAWSPDSKTLATGAKDKTVKLWNKSGQLLATLTGHTGTISALRWSPDGKTLASSSEDNTVKLWSESGQLIATLSGHTGNIYNLAWSPDAKTLASASSDKTVRLWDASGQQLAILSGQNGAFFTLSWLSGGKTLATGSMEEVRLWNTTGQLTGTINVDGGPSAVSPTSQTIASCPWAFNSIKLSDASGKTIVTLGGHTGQVIALAWSPDGKILASGSMDNTIRLWQISK